MIIVQIIYTSTGVSEITPLLSHKMSAKSVKVCVQLGITGRVFANDYQTIGIMEGPAEIVMQYYNAIAGDSLCESIFLHVEHKITQREFSDYSVWLNASEIYDVSPHVHALTKANLSSALPKNPSAKIRIMTETFLVPEILNTRRMSKV